MPNCDELGTLAANVNRMNDELRRVYRELEAASTHKSEFLADMSHELRTPLNAIIGFSQVLRERMFGDVNEKQEEYLDDILSSGNHLLSLINDVLDLSKVEAGQIELELAPFSLRASLERGVVMVRERATRDRVRLSFAAAPEVDVVTGDERRIRQVIFNLLSNAVKFTLAGGSVDVSAARVDGEVRVSVAERGPASPSPTENGSSRSSSKPGTGVEQREGTGWGSRFEAAGGLHGGWIGPTGSSEREASSSSRCPRGPLAVAGERILVVEDNGKNMKLFRDVLRATGYDVLEATTGRRAVELAVEQIARSHAHGHPATGPRRARGARPPARRRAHRGHPGARADGPGDARGTASSSRGWLRRVLPEARGHRRPGGHGEAALRGRVRRLAGL